MLLEHKGRSLDPVGSLVLRACRRLGVLGQWGRAMIALARVAQTDDLPFRTVMAYPPAIVAVEAFMRDRMGVTAADLVAGMGVTKSNARRLLWYAHSMGLIARVDTGFYSVHVRHAREARIP